MREIWAIWSHEISLTGVIAEQARFVLEYRKSSQDLSFPAWATPKRKAILRHGEESVKGELSEESLKGR